MYGRIFKFHIAPWVSKAQPCKRFFSEDRTECYFAREMTRRKVTKWIQYEDGVCELIVVFQR